MSKLKHKKKFHENGELWREEWWLNGELHNEEGPATVNYRRDGSVIGKWWWLNGKLHNEEGPAYIGYKRDGSVWVKEWYLDGVQHTEEEWHEIVFRKVFEEQILR